MFSCHQLKDYHNRYSNRTTWDSSGSNKSTKILCINKKNIRSSTLYRVSKDKFNWVDLYLIKGGFSGGSGVKNLPMQEIQFDPCVGKIPWRRKWQPTPVLLPGKSHGQKGLVSCSPWGHKSQTRFGDWTTKNIYQRTVGWFITLVRGDTEMTVSWSSIDSE